MRRKEAPSEILPLGCDRSKAAFFQIRPMVAMDGEADTIKKKEKAFVHTSTNSITLVGRQNRANRADKIIETIQQC